MKVLRALAASMLLAPVSYAGALTLETIDIENFGASPSEPWTVHVSSVNVRSGPSTSTSIVGSLANGAQVSGVMKLVVETDEEWLEFDYNGQTAYISGVTINRVHPDNQVTGNIPIGSEVVTRYWGVPISYEANDLQPLPSQYALGGSASHRLRAEALAKTIEMFDDAAAAGEDIRIGSSYRSGPTQKSIYDNNVANSSLSQRFSAPPGHSEHQLGTTIDLTDAAGVYYLSQNFDVTSQWAWLNENAWHYGFFQTYREDNLDTTGYIVEPWHWRYVGVPAANILVDNGAGAPGYTESGPWTVSGAGGYLGGSYSYEVTGAGADSATFSASLPFAGKYAVYTIYTAGGNRPDNAQYIVNHAGGSTAVSIDQTDNNQRWFHVGVFDFNAGTASVTLDAAQSTPAGKALIADAIRFVSMPGSTGPAPTPTTTPTATPTPPPVQEIILDNDAGQPEYSETETWTTSSTGGYNNGSYRYDSTTDGYGGTATWADTLSPGDHEVFVMYRAGGNRPTSAVYRVNHVSGTATVTIDQTQNSMTWVSLGIYYFDGASSIVLDADASAPNGRAAIADAVRLVRTSPVPTPTSTPSPTPTPTPTPTATPTATPTPTPTPTSLPEVIVDNSDPEYSETGTWTTSGSGGWNGTSYRYDSTTDGYGGTATWDATLYGNLEVFVMYRAGSNRPDSAVYRVNHSGGSSTVTIDQTQNSMTWVSLGVFNFNGASSVVLDADASAPNGRAAIADAVRFVLQ